MIDSYIRFATIDSVTDGDSVVALIDLGFSAFSKVELRLLDVYAFETKGTQKELGVPDREELINLMPVGSKVSVQTFKTKTGKDKKSFTRYIAKVWLENGQLINDILKQKTQGGIGKK